MTVFYQLHPQPKNIDNRDGLKIRTRPDKYVSLDFLIRIFRSGPWYGFLVLFLLVEWLPRKLSEKSAIATNFYFGIDIFEINSNRKR